MSESTLRFVDLFSGLGGFHVALAKLGHKCVFAAEIDKELRDVYFHNFGFMPRADVRCCWKDIPPHDVLCAGFPCQPFSKAGNQLGFRCPASGDLFDYILNIIDRHTPQFLFFENVPNILRHANGQTWTRIQHSLISRGYSVDFKEISPHQIGIPQVRYRAIIVASKNGLNRFEWPLFSPYEERIHISSVLDSYPREASELPRSYIDYLEVWQEFLDRLGKGAKMPSFPIWSMEYGATYPVEKRAPSTYSQRHLGQFHGSFGESLKGRSKEQQLAALPSYASENIEHFPSWKIRFINQNREFFLLHEKRLCDWIPKVRDFASSFQKFEWNWQEGNRCVWDKIVQFRASGIRVKNPATAPSLVALSTSQVPVVAWEKRYMTILECARLQSLGDLAHFPRQRTHAFKALGNAVNADIIYLVAQNLLDVQYDTSGIVTLRRG